MIRPFNALTATPRTSATRPAPFAPASLSRRFAVRSRLTPLIGLGAALGCSLAPAKTARAETVAAPPVATAKTPATLPPSMAKAPIAPSTATPTAVVVAAPPAPKTAAPLDAPIAVKAPDASALPESAVPQSAAVSALKTAGAALRQRTQIRFAELTEKDSKPEGGLLRLAQLSQGRGNTPAAAPNQDPPRLEVPVGPSQTPPIGNAAPVPPNNTTPTPLPPAVNLPEATSTLPPLIGDVQAAEGREISDVRVVGNRVIPAETILAQVRTQRGAAFSGRQAELDRGRVSQLGFFLNVQVQVLPDVEQPNKIVATFIVQENRVVQSYRFVNLTSIKDADIIPLLNSKIGVVLNRNLVDQDIAAIQKLYNEKGFAGIVQDVNLNESGVLTFTLQEARVSRVDFQGLGKTRPSLIRRQIRVRAGDTFDASRVRRDINRIYDLGFFDNADFKIDDDPQLPGSVILTYIFKEKRTGQLSFGVGFDSRSRISGFASVNEYNFKGSGKRLGLSLETGSRRNYELSFGNPFIGEKNASFDASIYNRTIFRQPRLVGLLTGNGSPVINPDGTISFNGNITDNTYTYQEERTGGRLNFTKPLDYDRRRTLLFGYRNERARLFQIQNSATTVVTDRGVALANSGRISAFSTGFLRDVRDRRIDASRGNRQQFIVEQAVSFLGDTTFTKFDGDFRIYLPLVKPVSVSAQPAVVFATRFVGGRSLKQLPSFEQYFVGGSDTVRGYNTEEQFGDNQVYTNFELRYRFQPKIQIVGFFDAGSAFGGKFSSSSSFNLLTGYGAGVRLQTPIGLVRLDLAKGSRGFQTQFGIGPSF